MYQKKCSSCGENSYSSSKKGEWKCPVCCNDLSDVETVIAAGEDE